MDNQFDNSGKYDKYVDYLKIILERKDDEEENYKKYKREDEQEEDLLKI